MKPLQDLKVLRPWRQRFHILKTHTDLFLKHLQSIYLHQALV